MTKLTLREKKIASLMASSLISVFRSDPDMNKLAIKESEIILVYLKARGAEPKIIEAVMEKIASDFAAETVSNELNRIFRDIRREKN